MHVYIVSPRAAIELLSADLERRRMRPVYTLSVLCFDGRRRCRHPAMTKTGPVHLCAAHHLTSILAISTTTPAHEPRSLN